jgi:hypothetical protein
VPAIVEAKATVAKKTTTKKSTKSTKLQKMA